MIIYDLQTAKELLPETAVAFGNFDGVHLGHQALIQQMTQSAELSGLKSAVFTFRDLPVNEIFQNNLVKKIMTPEEKLAAIAELSVDYIICIPFDTAIQTMSPENFASDIIRDTLHCRKAFCGFNYSFGYKGEGNPQTLRSYGEKFGFDTVVMPDFTVDGLSVSSTLIRSFLEVGDVENFSRYSGRCYHIRGTVSKGQHLGTRMGFPTVNLNLSPEMALPRNGVYVSNIYVNNMKYKSVTNVGNKPTVGSFTKNAETHIFDFSEDLYGKDIEVEFLAFLRPEQKFDNLQDLEKQIAKDCENALHFSTSVL